MLEADLAFKIRATIGAYIKGLADRDVEAICQLFTEDATIEDPVGTPPRRGICEVREFYEWAMAINPRMKVIGSPIIAGAYSATPVLGTFELDGRDVSVEMINVMSFTPEGKITSMTAYFDLDTASE